MTLDTVLRMSVLNGVLEIRKKLLHFPHLPLDDMPSILRAGGISEARYDYETAVLVVKQHPNLRTVSVASDRCQTLRDLLQEIVLVEQPTWMRSIPLGRRVLKRALREANIIQCFESAGLYDDAEDTHAWWRNIGATIRTLLDVRNADTGNEGERLTFEHETRRLAEAGVPHLVPKWDAREDSTLGYDIQSYILASGGHLPLLIECKACSSEPLVFHVTQKQWKIAESREATYLFHVWSLKDEVVTKITPQQLRPHIPRNKGAGVWESVEVTWRDDRVVSALIDTTSALPC